VGLAAGMRETRNECNIFVEKLEKMLGVGGRTIIK
jgi:hypothetical protein